MFTEIKGNIILEALSGNYDAVCQGVNCFSAQASGLAPQMVKAFGTDKFNMEDDWYKGDINKLGTIDYQTGKVFDGRFEWAKSNNIFDGCLIIINAYTQFHPGSDARYDALGLCLQKINHIFKGKSILFPLIGCGIGGLIWSKESPSVTTEDYLSISKDVKTIIQEELKDCDVTIVHYQP